MPATFPFPRDMVLPYLQGAVKAWRVIQPDGVPLAGVYTLLQARQRPTPRPREGEEDLRQDLAPTEAARLRAAGLTPEAPTPERERPPGAREAPQAPPPPPVPLAEALRQAGHLVLVGEPGAGKSTTLQYLGLVFACAALQALSPAEAPEPCGQGNFGPVPLGLEEQRLPFLLRLPDLDPTPDRAVERALLKAWHDLGGPANLDLETLVAWREQGALLVLLDGLDEVSEGRREKVREALRTFGLRAGRCRMVVATRPAGHLPLGEPFREYTLQPLDEETAPAFLKAWLTARRGTPDAAEEARAAWQAIQVNPALRRLSLTPLTLKMLAEVVADEGAEALARMPNRARLYDRYVQVLWHRAEARGAQPENRSWAEELLEAWAWARHTEGRRTEKELKEVWTRPPCPHRGETQPLLSSEKGRTWEAARRLVREQLGLLVAQGKEWAFTHLTWQEYFVARRLQRAWRDDSKATWHFLRPRLHHPAWQEPLALLTGLLPEAQATALVRRIWQANSPYEGLLHRDLLLAARLVAQGAPVAEEARRTLVRELSWLLNDPRYPLRARRAAAGVLGQMGPRSEVLSALVRALRDSRWEVRWAAAQALGRMAPPAATTQVLSALTRALGDEEWLVRAAVAETLGQMGAQPEVLLALTRALGDEDGNVRAAAAVALGQMGPQAATPEVLSALTRALGDEDGNVRAAAAEALGRMGPQAATPEVLAALIRALKDREARVREAVAGTLGQMGPGAVTPEALAALAQLLKDKDGLVRETAAGALVQMGPQPEIVATLIHALGDEDGRVREVAAEALSQMEPQPLILAALIRALKDENWVMRAAAAKVLGEMGPLPEALSALTHALRDENKWVRWAVAEALQMGPEAATLEVLTALIHVLENQDEDEDVRVAAAETLGRMGPEAATPEVLSTLVRTLRDEDGWVRVAAAEALGQMGPQAATQEVLSALVRTLRDEDGWVRVAAAEALGQMGPQAATQEVLSALTRALGDKDGDVRRAAAWALGRMGLRPEVLEALSRALEDKAWEVRRAAIEALGKMGPLPQVLALLTSALGDEEGDVRVAAAEALRQMGPEAATPEVLLALIRALGDEDWRVRRAVAEALRRAGPEVATPEVLKALISALKDKDARVRRAVAEVLGEMGPTATAEVLSALVQALGDEEWRVRAATVGSLGKIEPQTEVLRALTHALEDVDARVRWAAVKALEQMASALDRKQTRHFARSLARRAREEDAAYEALQAVAERQTELAVQKAQPKDPLCPAPPPGWVRVLGRLGGAFRRPLLETILQWIVQLILSALLVRLGWLYREHLRQAWQGLMPAQRLGLVLGALLAFIGLAALARWLWQRRG